MIPQHELAALLGDDDCPWATLARSKDTRAIMVDDAVRFVQSRTGAGPSVEAQLDNFVRSVGGRRVKVIDPWRYLARLLPKSLRGPEDSGDVYEIPRSALPPSASAPKTD